MRVLALALLATSVVACKEPPANTGTGPAPCCVSSTSAKPAETIANRVEDGWSSLLLALQTGDDAGIAKHTTPAGLASLRAGVHDEPEKTAFARWGKLWAKWETRWKQKSDDKAHAVMGPEVKEAGLDFVKVDGVWKLDRWSPGE